ncbi:MAG: dihydroneopterin aldolase [Clostridiales bacterium]
MALTQIGLPDDWQQMDRINLHNWHFWACHGVYAEEKINKQEFSLDISLFLTLQEAGLNDDLNLTVDYGLLYGKVKNFVEENSFQLLEALAEKLAVLILEDPKIRGLIIGVSKCKAQAGNDFFTSQVEIKRQREA